MFECSASRKPRGMRTTWDCGSLPVERPYRVQFFEVRSAVRSAKQVVQKHDVGFWIFASSIKMLGWRLATQLQTDAVVGWCDGEDDEPMMVH